MPKLPLRRASLLAVGLVVFAAQAARAEDRITIRGAYYREPSTRVVQPMVEIRKDVPGEVDMTAHYLLDAITSASIAAGVGRDAIFTELRNEVGFNLGWTWGRNHVSGHYTWSHEPDYFSQTGGLSFSRGIWDNTGTISVNGAYSTNQFGALPMIDEHLKVYYLAAGYTQALSPTWLAQAVYDASYYHGDQANPYLSEPEGHETVPQKRLRHAFALRVAHYLPRYSLGFHLYYRFYFDQFPGDPAAGVPQSARTPAGDPWHMIGNTIEGRIYQQMGRTVELRLSYRVHRQSSADFWCNDDPSGGGRPGCYGSMAAFHSIDPKLGKMATQIPELKLLWDLRIFEGVPFFSFFAPGTLELSYGYYFQSDRYGGTMRSQTGYTSFLWPHDTGGAHLLQTGYSLPF